MRIIRDDFDQLVESFGASRRVVTRLRALARRGVFVSETVIEFATDEDGKPLQRLLLAKKLLDVAAKLDEDKLAKLAGEQSPQFFDENPLSVRAFPDGLVICLEEEADAEPETTTAEDEQTALAAIPEGRATSVIAKDEARRLLTSDEVSRLKMDLVTSSEPGRRLEAVRKLYLSELPRADKLKLFLTALRDRDADVRAEAARALGGLGLEGALTENLAKAARGATDERVVAVTNLNRVMEKVDPAQRQLALGLLIEFVTPSEEREVVQASLGVLATRIPAQDSGARLASHLHKQMIELLQVRYHVYEDACRKVYNTLFEHDRPGMSKRLTATVDEVSQPELRFFALSLITEHDLESASAPPVVKQLIEGLTTGSELDRNFQACGAALTRLGEKAVDGLLEALQSANDTAKGRIIDLLGHMLRKGAQTDYPVSKDSAARIAESFLSLYHEAAPDVCTALLESGFFEHPALTDEARRDAAEAFLESLHEFRFDRQVELVHAALERCGHVAVAPLRRAMVESGHDVTRATAARLLPEVIEHDEAITRDELETTVQEIREITDAEESDFPDRGDLYIALGRIGGHAGVPAKLAEELSSTLRERLGRSSNTYAILEGLGHLAAGRNLPRDERLEVGYLLLRVLKRGLPGMSGRIRKNEEGEEVLHFGRETTAYTDMIPRILEGLGRMINAEETPDALFEAITQDLIKLWKEIIDYQRIWAPAATMTLSRLLGQIALGERTGRRMANDIADLLSRKLILMPVMRVMSELMLQDQDSERMDHIAQKVFGELMKRLGEEPPPEATERRAILQALTSIAQRRRVGENERDIVHARKVIIEALFDAMRDRIGHAREMLQQLSETSTLSETMRNDIARRLKPAARRG